MRSSELLQQEQEAVGGRIRSFQRVRIQPATLARLVSIWPSSTNLKCQVCRPGCFVHISFVLIHHLLRFLCPDFPYFQSWPTGSMCGKEPRVLTHAQVHEGTRLAAWRPARYLATLIHDPETCPLSSDSDSRPETCPLSSDPDSRPGGSVKRNTASKHHGTIVSSILVLPISVQTERASDASHTTAKIHGICERQTTC